VSTPELSTILVNYNAGAELIDALRSVAAETAGMTWEAVVIDNASDEDSAEVVRLHPQARWLRNSRNVGFARAVNQGLAATSAPLVLIMNPDCRLGPGALALLRADLDSSPANALAGPRILNPDGSPQGSARGDPDMFTGLFGRTTGLRRLFPDLAVSRRNVVVDDGHATTVDWISGACMLGQRAALEAVNGFDERYFLYWEDADLCRRLRGRGYQIRYVPAASAVHRVGQSSRHAQAAATRAFHDSAYLYYSTHVAARSPSKRMLARTLLNLRCWIQLHLRRPAPINPRTHEQAPKHPST
jgi:GT2 family glycosyltransferase